jgi:hypothetical protein
MTNHERETQDLVRPEFAKNPPKILSTRLEPLGARYDGKQVRMTVTVAPEDRARVGDNLSFYGEGGEVFTLRAEGDGGGLYSGTVSVAAASLLSKEARFERLKASDKKGEVVKDGEIFAKTFEGRDFVAEEKVEEEKVVEDLESGKSVEVELKGLGLTQPEKTLLVNDLSVVEDPTRTFDLCGYAGDPNGAWTFKTLITAMANTPATGIAPEDFVRGWMQQFAITSAASNGELIEGRAGMMDIIAAWEALSGVGPSGPLDLDRAPFRLLAIVNRLDLSENLAYGGRAGEGRFVFGVVDPSDPCGALRFTVILEYGIPLIGCESVQSYACQWQALDALPFPSRSYNDALQALTDVFALADANPEQLPNRSAINQVRTNDNAFPADGQFGWEMREFKPQGLDGSSPGFLTHVQLARQPRHETPDGGPHPLTANQSPQLDDCVHNHLSPILAETHVVPDFWAGASFQAATVTYEPGMFFETADPMVDREARHKLSLNTCSSCHARETDTAFTHVGLRTPGTVSALSGFLLGNTVVDPGEPTTLHNFADLARRNQRLDLLCSESCSLQFAAEAGPIVH